MINKTLHSGLKIPTMKFEIENFSVTSRNRLKLRPKETTKI